MCDVKSEFQKGDKVYFQGFEVTEASTDNCQDNEIQFDNKKAR